MSLFDLSGKVAIVTGGNSGIGLGMARGLAGAGAIVVIAARDMKKSQDVVKALKKDGGDAFEAKCDVTEGDSVTAMVKQTTDRCGRIDILVNNAGTNIRKRPEDLKFEEWRFILDTNLDSAFRCSTACYPVMKQTGGGKILNNGSMMSLFGAPWSPAYAASKGGMVQFTKSLATAWAGDNIQVNCFLPGWIDTPLTANTRKEIKGLNETVLARTPAKRWGNIDDFRGIAVFLLRHEFAR
jgi:2-deoxy-D-gluconate 3-dehydrogenase